MITYLLFESIQFVVQTSIFVSKSIYKIMYPPAKVLTLEDLYTKIDSSQQLEKRITFLEQEIQTLRHKLPNTEQEKNNII